VTENPKPHAPKPSPKTEPVKRPHTPAPHLTHRPFADSEQLRALASKGKRR
jgi:hypothetical protein